MPISEPDSTIELVRRWHRGDAAALHELVQRDIAWIRQRIRQRLGDALRQHGETEDFLQEAVVDILAYTPRFEPTDGDAWRRLVTQIVENLLRSKSDYYGRLRRDRARQRPLPEDSVLQLDPRRRPATTPSQFAMRNEEEAWLRLALDLIDPDDRDLIVAREWGGKPFGEIGVQLGLSENTARMRFQRALGRLADMVESLRRGAV